MDIRARPSSKEGSERLGKSSEVTARAGYKEILKTNQPPATKILSTAMAV